MNIIDTRIPSVKIIEQRVFDDERGFFFEIYNQAQFNHITDTAFTFLQDNRSCSTKGVPRGLHYQLPPKAQGKLISLVRGGCF